VLKLILMKT